MNAEERRAANKALFESLMGPRLGVIENALHLTAAGAERERAIRICTRVLLDMTHVPAIKAVQRCIDEIRDAQPKRDPLP